MSNSRSSSTVRNLRAVFEGIDPNIERPSSTTTERTSVGEGERVSKIRASFVSVERPRILRSSSIETNKTAMAEPTTDRHETLGGSANTGGATNDTTAKSANNASAISGGPIADSLPSDSPRAKSTQLPPSTNGVKASPSKTADAPPSSETAPPAHPDKPVTSAEEEPGALKPADPKSTSTAKAVSSPESAKKATRSSMARAVNQNTPDKSKISRLSLSLGQNKTGMSPASAPRSPYSPRRPTTSDSKSSELSQKSATPSRLSSIPGRSSLTAQTAASAARARSAISEATANNTSSNSKSLPIRNGPKSPGRAINVSSRLTAPTASFAAKHENTKPVDKTIASRKVSASSTARASLGGARTSSLTVKSGSEKTSVPTKKPAPKAIHADESFLARMTRPTASSSSRAQGHEKAETKPATKTTAAPRTRASIGGKARLSSVRKADKPVEVNGTKEQDGPATPTAANDSGKVGTPATSGPALDSTMAALSTPGVTENTIR